MKKLLLAGCLILITIVNTQAQRWEEIEQFNPEFNHGSGMWMGFSVAIDGELAAVGAPRYDNSKGIVGIYLREGIEWKLLTTLQADGDKKEFGSSVGVSGNLVVIGCYNDSLVYVYDREGATVEKIALPERENDQRFGRSVAIHNNTIVVGAEGTEKSKGVVYIFEKKNSTWALSQKLVPEDQTEDDRFGHAVDVSQDRILVGAMNSNAAYIFERTENEWKQSARLSVPFTSDYVIARPNSCVSIQGNIAVVGAPYNSEGGWRAGAAFVFEKEGSVWKQTARLDPSDVDRIRQVYGHSVSIAENTIVVGSWGTGEGVYLYEKEEEQWTEIKKIIVDSTDSDHNFSVAMSGSTIITGGPFSQSENGSAFFLERHPLNWHDVRIQKVDMAAYPIVVSDHKFGQGVALKGNIAVIGAPGDDIININAGAAYVYKRTKGQWKQQTKLMPKPSYWHYEHKFGSDVSIYDHTILIGAYSYRWNTSRSGAAYIYHETDTGWVSTEKLVAWEKANRNDSFGQSVALYDSIAMVSASSDSTNQPVVYVFIQNDTSWVPQTKLTSKDGEARFGASLALEGNTAIVGAPGLNCEGGVVYIFNRNGSQWTQTAKLAPKDATCHFGDAVAIAGNTIIIGSSEKKAYIFENSGSEWTQVAELATDIRGSSYGSHKRVAISDKYALVGSSKGGVVYTFAKPQEGWKDMIGVNRVGSADQSEGDLFGSSVALSEDVVLIGASHGRYQQGAQSGKAYFFKAKSAGQSPTVEDQTFFINSSSPDSTFVGTVTASDPENNSLFFRIIDGDPDRDFSIDPLTGDIHLQDERILNWSNVSPYKLTVGVGDGDNIIYATVTIIVNMVTGIDEPPLERLYSVYPNPTQGKVLFRSNRQQAFQGHKLVIMNFVGSVVLTQKVTDDEIIVDLSQHPSGIYLLQLEGVPEETIKIIKK